MFVTKASGEQEEFNPTKLERTLKRAGAPNKLAKMIIAKIKDKFYDGIHTKEILDIALKELETQENYHIAARYNLKQAMMELGPAGYDFENYISELLSRTGYDTKVRQKIFGKCVLQEIDVVASDRKTNETIMVECKYHNRSGIYCGLKEAMYTYARCLDLQEGFKANKNKIKFNRPWLVTNTKISTDGLKYSKCQGMYVTAWRFGTLPLEKLIEKGKFYPITILRTIDAFAKKKFADADLALITDILNFSSEQLAVKTGLPESVAKKAQMEIAKIIE